MNEFCINLIFKIYGMLYPIDLFIKPHHFSKYWDTACHIFYILKKNKAKFEKKCYLCANLNLKRYVNSKSYI